VPPPPGTGSAKATGVPPREYKNSNRLVGRSAAMVVGAEVAYIDPAMITKRTTKATVFPFNKFHLPLKELN
jgi:hypothetical protein